MHAGRPAHLALLADGGRHAGQRAGQPRSNSRVCVEREEASLRRPQRQPGQGMCLEPSAMHEVVEEFDCHQPETICGFVLQHRKLERLGPIGQVCSTIKQPAREPCCTTSARAAFAGTKASATFDTGSSTLRDTLCCLGRSACAASAVGPLDVRLNTDVRTAAAAMPRPA